MLNPPNFMTRYLLTLFFFFGCVENTPSVQRRQKDSILTTNDKPVLNYDRLKEYLLSADSVVLLSHESPNMLIRNPKTGKYYRIPFIEHEKINYATSVRERKEIHKMDVRKLADILTLPAIDDSIAAACFHPRNAVVAFKDGRMFCFDFCFECRGFNEYGNFVFDLIMNREKYKRLYAFYRKRGFKYEME